MYVSGVVSGSMLTFIVRGPWSIAVPVPVTDYYPHVFGCNGETGFGARIRSWLDSSRR